MAIQQTVRFGIDRPDGPADVFDLAQILDFIDAVEAFGAKASHGAIAGRPPATAAWAKGFYVVSDAAGGGILGALYYCTGAAWLHLNPQQALDFGEVGDIAASAPGDAAAAGATGEVADAGHRHAREAAPTAASVGALPAAGKAVDSELLDGLDSTAFVQGAAVAGAAVATQQSTTSMAYTDLATVLSVVANIGASGRALVMMTAHVYNDTINRTALMGFAVSGATVRAVVEAEAIETVNLGGNALQDRAAQASVVLVTGLTPGANTFTAKHRVDNGTGQFKNRRLTVIPL